MSTLSVVCRPFVRRRVAALCVSVVVAGLSGCYVVPIDPRTGQPAPMPSGAPAAAPAPALPISFPARLYPANELASGYGVVNATVTNDLHGRGSFNANINGESFVGEATRKAGSSREGLANGTGNRGSYLSCQYTMNSATLGTGTCRLNNGAVFT
ncbi:MAG: hypothetical protein ACTS8S_09205, partial [Giesbergeria sp.]